MTQTGVSSGWLAVAAHASKASARATLASPDSCPTAADGSGQAGSTLTISPIAGQTIYLKFDGANPGSNANPPYEGPFTLVWAMQ